MLSKFFFVMAKNCAEIVLGWNEVMIKNISDENSKIKIFGTTSIYDET